MNDATIRPADWRNESVMKPLGQQGGNRYGLDAKKKKKRTESFFDYINNYGQVHWKIKVYKSSTEIVNAIFY